LALQKIDSEVVVIGAGAAGLAACGRAACPASMCRSSWARSSFTATPGQRALQRQAGLRAAAASHKQRYVRERRLLPVDAFAEAQRAMKGAAFEDDVSFADFLRRRRLPEKRRLFARMMVEGFDAADPERASARAIAEEWGEGGALGNTQPRVQGGYGALLEWLARDLVRHGGRLRMQSVVREVRWRRGRVTVFSQEVPFHAEKVVLTLPLGVLQSGAVEIEWPMEKTRALKQLVSGPVVKAALRFPTRFWDKRAPNVAFFHAPRAPFPSLWTPLPARVPRLIAWAGRPEGGTPG
jgi:monoamine oxidase